MNDADVQISHRNHQQVPPVTRTTVDKKKGMIYLMNQKTMHGNFEEGDKKRKFQFDPLKFPKMAAKIAKWQAEGAMCFECPTDLTATDGDLGSCGLAVGAQ